MASSIALAQRFAQCTCVPITSDLLESSRIVSSDDGSSMTSFLMDASGRSKFILHFQLVCPSKEDVDLLVESGCLPLGQQQQQQQQQQLQQNHESNKAVPGDYGESGHGAIRLEIKTHAPNHDADKFVTVQDVKILSCLPRGHSIVFEAELDVRSSTSIRNLKASKDAFHKPIIAEIHGNLSPSDEMMKHYANAQLDVTAVMLTPRNKHQIDTNNTSLPVGLTAMQLCGGVIPFAEQSPSLQTRLKPFSLLLSLTQAFHISANAVPGSSSGNTLVALTMMHSNTHDEPVTITNIAFHPGQSQHVSSVLNLEDKGSHQSMPGGQNAVIDMSKYVKWGFGGGTELALPLTIHRHEAYSTVLTIEAGEDLRSRSFVSPISVTAIVGNPITEHTTHTTSESSQGITTNSSTTCSVVETTTVQWTTGRVAVEPADAFRIDLSLQQSSACHVGAPLVVALRVLNLSHETRDLMLLMAKDDEGKGNAPNASIVSSTSKHGSVNTAIVSEVNGYTFGVWGLAGDDDGTIRHSRDHELLAVDAALLLGEVKGQHSVDAELRFVPLREGTLNVPNLKLYDKTEGKWYNCVHMLKIVAAAAKAE